MRIVKLSIEPRSWIHNPQKRSDGGKENGEDLAGRMSGVSLHALLEVKPERGHSQTVTKKSPQAWSCFYLQLHSMTYGDFFIDS